MSEYILVPVSLAQQIAESCEKDWVIILARDHAHDKIHVATFGKTAMDKQEVAALGDMLPTCIGSDPNAAGKIFEDWRLVEKAKYKEMLDRANRTIYDLMADTILIETQQLSSQAYQNLDNDIDQAKKWITSYRLMNQP